MKVLAVHGLFTMRGFLLSFSVLARIFLPAHFLQCASIARVATLHAQRFPNAPKGVSHARRHDQGYDNILYCHNAEYCL